MWKNDCLYQAKNCYRFMRSRWTDNRNVTYENSICIHYIGALFIFKFQPLPIHGSGWKCHCLSLKLTNLIFVSSIRQKFNEPSKPKKNFYVLNKGKKNPPLWLWWLSTLSVPCLFFLLTIDLRRPKLLNMCALLFHEKKTRQSIVVLHIIEKTWYTLFFS